MVNFGQFNSLISVINHFHDESICKDALADARWGDDVVCPICGQHHCTKRKDGRYRCNNCKHNFSATVGTIFENTNLPLKKWFIALYLISSHKKGVSSHQLARDCEVTQKTAWYMLHKIRTLFAQDDAVALDGEVEIDEMYLGGRETNKHESKKTEGTQGRSTKTKTPIFGMVQRNGKVIAMKVEDTKAKTLMPIIKQFVRENAHLLTDELVSYRGLNKEGYNHDYVSHGTKEFVRPNGIHTNSVEGFWAHFKRVVFGTYHFVSKTYLQRYIDEQLYRWNTRKASTSERFSDMFAKSIGIVRYWDVKMVG